MLIIANRIYAGLVQGLCTGSAGTDLVGWLLLLFVAEQEP